MMKSKTELQYVRTDKNGTMYYNDYACGRCWGTGYYGPVCVHGGICFECGGTGKRTTPRVVKKYTPEYQAKLDAKRAIKNEKKRAEQIENAIENSQKWFGWNAFNSEGKTYIILGDTLSIKEELKSNGAKYHNCLGWHMDHKDERYNSIEVDIHDIGHVNAWGNYEYSLTVGEQQINLKDYINNLKAEAEPSLGEAIDIHKSEYIGEVGQRITKLVELISVFGYDTKFGWTNVYKMKDENGDIIVWKSGTELPDKFEKGIVSATIKEHSEYRGEKQTVVTRLSVVA